MKLKRLLAVVALGPALLADTSKAQNPAPPLLPFQGRLTDANGSAIADGARVVQFKIYDAPVGGQAVWNGEVQKLTVNAGMVNTLLGTKADLSRVDFNRTLYLEITIDANADNQITPADPPLLPRQTILPAVFAKESAISRKLSGWDWGSLLNTNDPVNGKLSGAKLADGSLPASKIADGSVPGSKINANSITGTEIADAAVTAQKIAADTITLTNLSAALLRFLNPPGTIAAFAGATNRIPSGWLPCDGGLVSTNRYLELFNSIGTNWGAGSPGWFVLPDLRGVFLRGVDLGRGKDPDRASRTNQTTGGNVGDAVGSIQSDAFLAHRHKDADYPPTVAGFPAWESPSSVGRYSPGPYSSSARNWTSEEGGNETRPKNAYVNYIIKY